MTMRAESGHAALFVSNVLSPTGSPGSAPPPAGLCTVVRFNVALAPGTRPRRMTGITVVGSGFPWRQNKAALDHGQQHLSHPARHDQDIAGQSGYQDPDQRRSAQRPARPRPGPDGDLIAVNGGNGNAIEVAASAGRWDVLLG